MTPELQAELLRLIKSAESFTAEQAPMLAQEMLHWAYIEPLLWLVMAASLLVAMCAGIYFTRRYWDAFEQRDLQPLPITGTAVVGCGAVFALVACVFTTGVAIYAYVAPRAYLLDKIGDML